MPATFTCDCLYRTTPTALTVRATCTTPAGSVPALGCHCADAGATRAVTAPCVSAALSPSIVEVTFEVVSNVCSMQIDAAEATSCVGPSCLEGEAVAVHWGALTPGESDPATCTRRATTTACTKQGPCDCVPSATWTNGTCAPPNGADPCDCKVRVDTREVLVPARDGGAECTDLTRTVHCGGCGECEDPCASWEWSPWSPCSTDCASAEYDVTYGPGMFDPPTYTLRSATYGYRNRTQRLKPFVAHLQAQCADSLLTERHNCTDQPLCSETDTVTPSCILGNAVYRAFAPPCGYTARTEEYAISATAPGNDPYGCPPATRKHYTTLRPCIFDLDDPLEPTQCVGIFDGGLGPKCHEDPNTGIYGLRFRQPSGTQMQSCISPDSTTAPSEVPDGLPVPQYPRFVYNELDDDIAYTAARVLFVYPEKRSEQTPLPVPPNGAIPAYMQQKPEEYNYDARFEAIVPPLFLAGSGRGGAWERALTYMRVQWNSSMDAALAELRRERDAPTTPVQRGRTYEEQSCFLLCRSYAGTLAATRPCLVAAQEATWSTYANNLDLLEPTSDNQYVYTALVEPDPNTGRITRVRPLGYGSSDTYHFVANNGETITYRALPPYNDDAYDWTTDGVPSELVEADRAEGVRDPGGSAPLAGSPPSGRGVYTVHTRLNLTVGYPVPAFPCRPDDDGSWRGCGSYEVKCLKNTSDQTAPTAFWYLCPWAPRNWTTSNVVPLTWPGRNATCTPAESRAYCSPPSYARPFIRHCVRPIVRYNDQAGHEFGDTDVRPCESRPCTGSEQRAVCHGAHSHACEYRCFYNEATRTESCRADEETIARSSFASTGACFYASSRPARFCTHAERERVRETCRTTRSQWPSQAVADPTCRVTCDDDHLTTGCRVEVRCNATHGDHDLAWVPLYGDLTPLTPASSWANTSGVTQLDYLAQTRACTPTEQLTHCGAYAHECRVNATSPYKLVDGVCGPASAKPVRACTDRELMDSCALGVLTSERRQSRFCRVTFNGTDLFWNRTVEMICSHTELVFTAAAPAAIDPFAAINNYGFVVPKVHASHTLSNETSEAQCGAGWATDRDRRACSARVCRYTHRDGFAECECDLNTCGCPNRQPVNLLTRTGVPCASPTGERRVLALDGHGAGGPNDARTYCGTYAESALINCTLRANGTETCALSSSNWGEFAPCACNTTLGAPVAPLGGLPCGGTAAACTPREMIECGEAAESCQFVHGQGPSGVPVRNSTLAPLEYTRCRCLHYAVTGASLESSVRALLGPSHLNNTNFTDPVLRPLAHSTARYFPYWNTSLGYDTLEAFFASQCVFPLDAFDGANANDTCRNVHDFTTRMCDWKPGDSGYVASPDPYRRRYVSTRGLVRWPADYNHTTHVVPVPAAAAAQRVNGKYVRFVGSFSDFVPSIVARTVDLWDDGTELDETPHRVTPLPNSVRCPMPDTMYAIGADGAIECVPTPSDGGSVSLTATVQRQALTVTVPVDAHTPQAAMEVGSLLGGWVLNLTTAYSGTVAGECVVV